MTFSFNFNYLVCNLTFKRTVNEVAVSLDAALVLLIQHYPSAENIYLVLAKNCQERCYV